MELDAVLDAGERIGGLQFEPLSIKRNRQMVAALSEKLPEQDAALFTMSFESFASIVSAAGGSAVEPSVFMAQFHSILREHAETVLQILSEFSGHPVVKLEELTPNEIRRAFEVMLQIPTSVGWSPPTKNG
jgi:hypothetical protein